jgi:hypothetical protein
MMRKIVVLSIALARSGNILLVAREIHFSHYYGVLTPLIQWWKKSVIL